MNIAVQINLSTHIPFRPHSKSETTILKLNLVPVPKLSALLEQERPDNVRKLHLFARSTIKINIKRRTSLLWKQTFAVTNHAIIKRGRFESHGKRVTYISQGNNSFRGKDGAGKLSKADFFAATNFR